MIVTLCGSLRYESAFREWDERLTFAGHTVFTVSVYPSYKGKKDWYTEDQKRQLDEAHLRKIDISDAILVIDTNGYIGESANREIIYALDKNKLVVYTHYNHERSFVACPYKVCRNPLLMRPPCPLCYE